MWQSGGIPQVTVRPSVKQQRQSRRYRRDGPGLRQVEFLLQGDSEKIFRAAIVIVLHAETTNVPALPQRQRRLCANSKEAQKLIDAGRRALLRRQSGGREFHTTIRLVHRRQWMVRSTVRFS